MSALMVMPESADAQLFGGKKKRRKSSRKIGSFAGGSRAFNPEITYYAIGGGINALNYFGDIAPTPKTFSTDISFTRPGFNLFLKQKFGDRYSWRVNLMWGRLSASDEQVTTKPNVLFDRNTASRYLRNLDFRNDIYELTVSGQLDLIRHGGRFASRPPFNAYFFAGVGLFYHNPKGRVPEYFSTDAYQVDNPGDFQNPNPNTGYARYYPLNDAGEWVSLRDLGTEGQNFTSEQKQRYEELYGRKLSDPYSRIQLVIPVGIGARYKLSNNLDIGIEFSYRHTFTDYLDDVSGYHVDLRDFGNPADQRSALAMAMSDKSNQLGQSEFEGVREFMTLPVVTYGDSNSPDFDYTRAAGYGNPGGRGSLANKRGDGGSQNDIYIVTNITVTYILGGNFVRGAKFR